MLKQGIYSLYLQECDFLSYHAFLSTGTFIFYVSGAMYRINSPIQQVERYLVHKVGYHCVQTTENHQLR